MIEKYIEIDTTGMPIDLLKVDNNLSKEEIQKRLINLRKSNYKLTEENDCLRKEIEIAKKCGEKALQRCEELEAKNKRLVEEHNKQNGNIQALNIALDVIVDRYSSIRKKLLDRDGE